MGVRRAFVPVAGMLAVFMLGVELLPASGHPGPGTGGRTVTASLQKVTLVPAGSATSLNPELGNENYQLTTTWRHGYQPGDATRHGAKAVAAHGDYDTTKGLQLPFRSGTGTSGSVFNNVTETTAGTTLANGTNDWSHTECNPPESLDVTVALLEVDGGALAGALIGTGTALITAGLGLAAPTVGASLALSAAGIIGGAVGTLVGLDGDDVLGNGTADIPATGSGTLIKRIFPDKGTPEGVKAVDLEFSYSNVPASPPCANVTASIDHRAAVDDLYGGLNEIRVAAATAPPLPSDAPPTTRERTRAAATTATDLGGLVAAALVTDATPFEGAAEAVELLDAAGALRRDGDDDGALEIYAAAAHAATDAIVGGEAAGAPTHASPDVLLAPSRLVLQPDALVDVAGIVVGDVATEAVEIRGAPPGVTVAVMPGWTQQGVVLARELHPDGLREDELVGLGRLDGHRLAPPDDGCDAAHVVADPAGPGVTMDGRGPFATPGGGCGFGTVTETSGTLFRGAAPPEATLADDAAFRLRLDLDGAPPGDHRLTGSVFTSDGELPFAVDVHVDPGPGAFDPTVTREAGADRILTAIELSRAFPAGVDTVFLARADDFPDALAAGPATHGEGPVLLVTDGLTPQLREELRRLDPGRVVLTGGAAVLPDTVAADVRETLGGDVALARAWGLTRIGTAIAVSRLAFPDGAPMVAVTTARAFPDALSVGALAGREGGPLLLVEPGAVHDEVIEEIVRLGAARIVLAGGPAAVDESVAEQLRDRVPDAEVIRLSGADRYATSGAVAAGGFPVATTALVATGLDFPDALTATPVAIRASGIVLLIPPADVPPGAAAVLHGLGARSLVVAGGPGALPQDAVDALVGG